MSDSEAGLLGYFRRFDKISLYLWVMGRDGSPDTLSAIGYAPGMYCAILYDVKCCII